jgi:hypothetical protein
MEQSDKLAGNATLSPSLKRKLSAFTAELTEIRKKLLVTKVGDIRGEQQLREKVSELYGAIGDYYGRPTQSQIERLADLSVEADNMKATVDAIFTKNLASLNQQIGKASLAPIKILTREEFDAEGQE